MALNVNIVMQIWKIMPICLANKRNMLTHMCSMCASELTSAVWLILEAMFCLNDDYIHSFGSLHLICESMYSMTVPCRAARYIACYSHAYLISEVGSVILWNLDQLISNGVAFNTQSRSSLTSYAIRAQNRRCIACDSEREISLKKIQSEGAKIAP